METLIIIPGWVTKYIIEKDRSIIEYYEKILPYLQGNPGPHHAESPDSGFDVRIIEFPGFGTTPEPQEAWQLDNFVSFLKEYIEPLPPTLFDQPEAAALKRTFEESQTGAVADKVYLLGHSFGGQVATKFAYLYPEKVKKLILYNAACIRNPESGIRNPELQIKIQNLKQVGKIIFDTLPFLRKIYYKLFVGQTDYLKLSPVMQQTMSNILREDLADILPQIKIETLVLWGSQDKLTPLHQGLKIKKLIPNSKIIVHPGGHSFHLQDPKTFTEYVKNFIEK